MITDPKKPLAINMIDPNNAQAVGAALGQLYNPKSPIQILILAGCASGLDPDPNGMIGNLKLGLGPNVIVIGMSGLISGGDFWPPNGIPSITPAGQHTSPLSGNGEAGGFPTDPSYLPVKPNTIYVYP